MIYVHLCSLVDDEYCPGLFSEQGQELLVVDFPVPVQVCLVDHALQVDLPIGYRVSVHYLGQVVLVQLPVLVLVQFLEFLLQESLVPVNRTVQETCNELSVVDLTTVVEIHRLEDFSDIVLLQLYLDLLPEIIKTKHHFII